MKEDTLKRIYGGLIVSCQALEEEPLHSSFIMSRMAYAAQIGGACGIRANSVEDIKAIKSQVDIPVIGIIKREYQGSEIYITPTIREVEELMNCGVEIIAIDCTNGNRPKGECVDEFLHTIRRNYPKQLFMADCATYDEGTYAAELGMDLIGTTMCGYTIETKGTPIPNVELIERLVKETGKPVIAEGGIWTQRQLQDVMQAGAWAAVIGTAITRPQEITRRFVNSLYKR